MTKPGANLNSSRLGNRVKPKRTSTGLSLQASLLSTLLLCSGGATALATWVSLAPEVAIAQTPATANIIYVNPNSGADTAEAGTNEATPIRTIRYALGRASAGTIVQLAPGNYSEENGEVFPLVVPAGVTLRGDEASKGQNITIVGGESYLSRTEANQSVSVVASADSTISGVTITNPKVRGTGLWVESTNPTIRNNTFTNSRRDGILVTGAANPTIEDNLFFKNEGNGISIGRTARGEIRNNVFEATGFGIALSDTASPLIVQNRILNNLDGIVASGSTAPVLRENIIQGNTRDGLVAITNAQPDLGTSENPGQNLIRNNTRHDVNNATRTNVLQAFGNDIDASRVSGQIQLVTRQIASSFPDVQGHWAQPYIEALAAREIIAGFPNGTFRPTDPVTRAQFAAIINQAFQPTAQRPAISFTDVRSNFWAAPAIQTAHRGGFLAGYPGQVFRPEQQIPRVQVLVSLASGLNLTPQNTGVLSVYRDAAQIPAYAVNGVSAATERQLVINYPAANQLSPNQAATRAEVAAFVYQALVNAGRAEAIPSPYVVQVPSPAQQ